MSKLPSQVKLQVLNGQSLNRVKVAQNTWTRFLGLLPRGTQLAEDEGLLLTKCNSVHGFFMRITIDIIFINDKWEVVRLEKSCKPWRYTLFCQKAQYTLEVGQGTIARLGLKEGMAVNWQLVS